MQPKFSSHGISGTLFFVAQLAVLSMVFVFGIYVLAPNDSVVVSTMGAFGGYGIELIVKFGVLVVIVAAEGFLLFTQVLDTPLGMLLAKYRKPRNNSHAVLMAGLLIATGVAVSLADASSARQFLYVMCTKAVVGHALAIVLTILYARLVLQVQSMDEFRDWVDQEDNDSHSMLIAAAFVVTMTVAMSA